jgi:GT2 family glycosyltransferase/glycosyltransferase involved in cell wall biosynthesis
MCISADSTSVEPPLVSVVMPAYKPFYIEQTLASLRAQSHRPLELVVCDDSPGEEIEQLVSAYAQEVDFPVLYQRNQPSLGEARNLARCIALASGRYIKFLHDDDVLMPDCIAALRAVLDSHPEVSLVTSSRRNINERGQELPDHDSSRYPFAGDALLHGADVIDYIHEVNANFIGEPSTALCRREHALALGDDVYALNGNSIELVGDMALWCRLLRHGHLAMLAQPLCHFRISQQQQSQQGRDRLNAFSDAREKLKQSIAELGWLQDRPQHRMVRVAPLAQPQAFESLDIRRMLHDLSQQAQCSNTLRRWQQIRALSPAQQAVVCQQLQARAQPRLGLFIRAHTPDASGALQATLNSLPRPQQLPMALELMLPAAHRAQLEDCPWPVQWLDNDLQQESAAGLNTALMDWQVDWLLEVQAGDKILPSGLLLLAQNLPGSTGLRALCADELQQSADNGQLSFALRSDFNLDLLLSHPSSQGRHWIWRHDIFVAAGGYASDKWPAQECDLLLRLVAAGGYADLGHLPEPLLQTLPQPPATEPEQRALLQHLHQRGYASAEIEPLSSGCYRIHYGHEEQPLVSILLAGDGRPGALQSCLLSLLEQTRYTRYEVLLVNYRATPPALRAWMAAVAPPGGQRLRLIDAEDAASHSDAVNAAARQARGDYLLLLRPDVLVLEPGWLQALLNHALRPEVGVVGARTVSSHGLVTHAGLVPALREVSGRIFYGARQDSAGYLQRLQADQNYLAVADSCLLIRRPLFDLIQGLDAQHLPDAGADVDLCLRARQQGYLCVWTPHATLQHDCLAQPWPEAVENTLLERWLAQLAHDPAHHRLLRQTQTRNCILDDVRLQWRPLATAGRPLIMAYPKDRSGCGHYRIMQPLRALQQAGLADIAMTDRWQHPSEVSRIAPDSIVFQVPVTDNALRQLDRSSRHPQGFRIFELDDYLLGLPNASGLRRHVPGNIQRRLRKALAQVDRLVVSTPRLAECMHDLHPEIRVVGNSLDPLWWGSAVLPASLRNCGRKPRVGWAGGSTHIADLALIADVVKALAEEVDWVFMGMMPAGCKPYVHEFHKGYANILDYPAGLAALNLDLAIAPLEDNLFTACKSNLRLLELGACGYPIICSDVPAFDCDLPVTRVKNRYKPWVEAIRMHLSDPAANAAAGDALRTALHADWMLEGPRLQAWLKAWSAD